MLISNFNREEKEFYLKVVKEYKKRTGNSDIYVDNNAYVNGVKLDELCALRCKSFDNVNIFYRIEDELANVGLNVICTNKETGKEIWGTIDKLIYDNDKLIGYDVTNCCNEFDLYIESFISFQEWYVAKNHMVAI